MNVYSVSLDTPQERYKGVYLRADSYAEVERIIAAKFPDHKITGMSLEGSFIDE